MKAEDKVRSVYPEAVCIRESGTFSSGKVRFQVLPRPRARKALGMDNQARRAWANAWRAIEREGVPVHCPFCRTALEPFEGEEDGPVKAWQHPRKGNGCQWDEWEGLSRHQIAAAGRRKMQSGR